MVIGILKDIKKGENRVIATPGEVATLIGDGNTVKVQKGAGEKAGFEDQAYAEAGAVLVDTAEEIYGTCEFVTKVKEFEPSEFDLLREGQIVFTCIHPAAHPEEVQALLDKKVIAFTAEDSHRYGSPNCEAALPVREAVLHLRSERYRVLQYLQSALVVYAPVRCVQLPRSVQLPL